MADGWVTPEDAAPLIPLTLILRLPDHSQARAQLRAFLLDCVNPEKYQDVGGISVQEAAAEWENTLEDFESQA